MQQELKLNPHGVAGIVSIILMFGLTFFLNWHINWWYFSLAVVLYSGAIILLTYAEEGERKNWQRASGTQREGSIHRKILMIFRWLLGCHLTLLFLAVGLFFPEPDFAFLCFFLSIFCGLSIPLLLLRISQNKTSIHLHGLAALLLIILTVGVFIFSGRNWILTVGVFIFSGRNWGKVSDVDATHVSLLLLAIFSYAEANLCLNPDFSSRLPPFLILRSQIGCHLAFIFLLVGAGLHFKDVDSVIGFFIGSTAMGLVIPYLLFRSL